MAFNPMGPVQLNQRPTTTPSTTPSGPGFFRRNIRRILVGGALVAGGASLYAANEFGMMPSCSMRVGNPISTDRLLALNTDRLVSEANEEYGKAQAAETAMVGMLRAGTNTDNVAYIAAKHERTSHASAYLNKIAELFGKDPNVAWSQWAQQQVPDGGSLNQSLSAYHLFHTALALRWVSDPSSAIGVGRVMMAEIRAKGWGDFARDSYTCGGAVDGGIQPDTLQFFESRHLVESGNITAADRANLAAYCASVPGAMVSLNPTTPDAALPADATVDAVVTTPDVPASEDAASADATTATPDAGTEDVTPDTIPVDPSTDGGPIG